MLALSIAFFCYSAIFLSFFFSDLKLQKFGFAVSSQKTLFTLLFVNALIAHLFVFIPYFANESGLVFSFANTLMLSSWSVSVLYFISSFKVALVNIGLVVLPLNLFFIASYGFYQQPASGQLITSSIAIHVTSSIIAFSVVMIAAIQALTITFQTRFLHQHQSNFLLKKLPALFHMKKVLCNLIDMAVIFLTLALLTGFMFLDDIFAQNVAHKTILSIFAWVIFTTLAIGRRLRGWHSKTVTRATISASALLVLGFLGSKLITEMLATP